MFDNDRTARLVPSLTSAPRHLNPTRGTSMKAANVVATFGSCRGAPVAFTPYDSRSVSSVLIERSRFGTVPDESQAQKILIP